MYHSSMLDDLALQAGARRRLVDAAHRLSVETGRFVSPEQVVAVLVSDYVDLLDATRVAAHLGAPLRHGPGHGGPTCGSNAHGDSPPVKAWMCAFGLDVVSTTSAAAALRTINAMTAPLVEWLGKNGMHEVSPVGLGRMLSRHKGEVCRENGNTYALCRKALASGVVWFAKQVPAQ